MGDAGDLLEQLTRLEAGRAADRDTGRDASFEPGRADHEELVEVAREDRQEPSPLQERHLLVGSELEHTLVELQPADLPVEEAVGRQVGCDVVLAARGAHEPTVGGPGPQLGRRRRRGGGDGDVSCGGPGARQGRGSTRGSGGIRHARHPVTQG